MPDERIISDGIQPYDPAQVTARMLDWSSRDHEDDGNLRDVVQTFGRGEDLGSSGLPYFAIGAGGHGRRREGRSRSREPGNTRRRPPEMLGEPAQSIVHGRVASSRQTTAHVRVGTKAISLIP